MRLGRCVRVDFGFIGCSTDVILILDRHCSGRSECRLRIPDAEMDETRPCLNDLTRYLSATYLCVPGALYYFSYNGKPRYRAAGHIDGSATW